MANIGTNAEISKIRLAEQGSDPTAPAAGYGALYVKTGGMYYENSGGTVVGPFGTGNMTVVTYDTDADGTVNASDTAGTATYATTAGTAVYASTAGTAAYASAAPWSGLSGTAIKLDDLSAPDDNTDLNAGTAAHGLCPKLDDDPLHFLNGQGGWTTPSVGDLGGIPVSTFDAAGDLLYGTADNAVGRLAIGTAGYQLKSDGTVPSWAASYAGINFVIDGGGAAIGTAIKGDIEVPFNCDIDRVTLLGDQSGSIVVNILKAAYADYPGTVSICGTVKPTLAGAAKYQDTTLTSWTTALTAGEIIRYVVESAATVQRCTVALHVRKT